MQTIIVIWGFMGPLMLIGIIGLIYMLYLDKKEQKRKVPREGGMRLSR
jgi:hypothetical protein